MGGMRTLHELADYWSPVTPVAHHVPPARMTACTVVGAREGWRSSGSNEQTRLELQATPQPTLQNKNKNGGPPENEPWGKHQIETNAVLTTTGLKTSIGHAVVLQAPISTHGEN